MSVKMLGMSGSEGSGEAPEHIRRSVFDEYTEVAGATEESRADSAEAPEPRRAIPPLAEDPGVAQRRRDFAELLGEFRRTAVLVPFGSEPGTDDEQGWLTADLNGIRFILAFSDEQALARYAHIRGEYGRKWTYRTVLGAKLLDVAVPAAGVPCGVALDCADAPEGGMVFPPVKGIVPDEAAVDVEDEGAGA
ncbi:hypothetical protein ACIBUY_19870 [Streptomyces sp. NPDC050085]|uniref:hypothetical protein n=1 Tax=Streptomyces sp. NPDC050085 TaxID=3365600 RepID=UPI0037B6126F